jgi:hypothetical protein
LFVHVENFARNSRTDKQGLSEAVSSHPGLC